MNKLVIEFLKSLEDNEKKKFFCEEPSETAAVYPEVDRFRTRLYRQIRDPHADERIPG